MSSVPIFVGQCGNQIGSSLFKVLEASKDPVNLWEKRDGNHSAILIDSEPKVIRSLALQNKRFVFPESNIISSRQGCGTNWALGYFGPSQSKVHSLHVDSLDAARREVEQCEAFSGFIVMHSLAGGTGSGLGSRLIEALRDDYGLAYILSCAVAPFSTGDSPLQHYNTLLTTAWLQRGISTYQEPWELLRSVCPMPAYKFVSVHHTISSKSNWDGVIKGLLQSTRKFSLSGERFSSITNVVVARGDSHGTFPSYISAIEKAVIAACHCVSWNPYPVDCWQGSKHFHLKQSEASATLCSNSNSVVELLHNTLSKAKLMYNAGGYLHWYKKYGCTEDIFEGAFETVQSIVDDYESAVT